jgi:hypothetical protein
MARTIGPEKNISINTRSEAAQSDSALEHRDQEWRLLNSGQTGMGILFTAGWTKERCCKIDRIWGNPGNAGTDGIPMHGAPDENHFTLPAKNGMGGHHSRF